MNEPLLQHFPWRWVLFWLIAPNLALILAWPMGGPPMGDILLISGCIALICSQAPWLWVRRVCALALTPVMLTYYISRNFNIDLDQIANAPTYFSQAAPLRSSMFVGAACASALSMAITWTQMPRVPRFTTPMNILLGFLAVTGVMRFDAYATAATRGSYDLVVDGAAFSSAVTATGHAGVPADRRNLVIVLVEGLGRPVSPAASALFAADWDRPQWRARYAVSSGAVPYFGATTSGEMRELCGRWKLDESVPFAPGECLPQRFRAAGYETTALHGFAGAMFDRRQWWPRAGFDHVAFGAELKQAGARACGGVFPGACDVDVPAQIAARLKAASAPGGRPQLVYWVTLNSHLPVIEDASIGTANCRYGGEALAAESPLLCPLFAVHHNLADALTRMAMDPALPPTDFLIVGDHMPPFFAREARMRFDSHHVPWILLQSRQGRAAQGRPPA
ncbi:sulfatase-like hydrolase/transferase [Novosphingobium bradum]|uniref:Sulfatase-like hydrolase/transferase n=1 Tax=Novosphingobium bradum TaxID=1737444 RepID=A0ABV7ISB5_9SPHN